MFDIKTIPPKILYHTSNPKVRELIRDEGLKPMIGDSYALHYQGTGLEIRPAIFLCNERYDSTFDDDVWEVNSDYLIEKTFADDGCFDGCEVTFDAIPVEAIKLIYEGTGKSSW